MLVPICQHELEMCRDIAHRRNNKNKGVPSLRIDQGSSDYAIHFFGALGELAFSKWIGEDIDKSVNKSGGDAGYDFKINGYTIDIKYTRSKHNCLLFPTIQRFKADLAVLTKPTHRNMPTQSVKIVGWTTREEFKEKSVKKDFGFGVTNCLPQKNLRRMTTFKKYIGIKPPILV